MLRYIVVAVLAVFLVVATDIEVWAGEFDGTWKYELNSRSSSPTCRGFGTGEVEILDSKFSGVVAHDQDTFRLTGSVDESGKGKNLKSSGNYDTAKFDMVFTQNAGSGTWNASNLGCSGTVKMDKN